MKEFTSQFTQIRDHLAGAQKVLIVAHQKPDGDTLGASLAIAHYLEHHDTPHVCFCIDKVPGHFAFMPDVHKFTDDQDELRRHDFDVICIVDSGDLSYAGVEGLLPELTDDKTVLINIDHHPTNTRFGHCNVVHDGASSTAEMVYHFLDILRHPISPAIATCLLTGILTDTGMFSNLATTPSSLDAASKLMGHGARINDIMRHTMRNLSLTNLQLWGRALSRLKEDPKTGIVSTAITYADFEELGVTDRSTEGVANFLNHLGNAKMVIVYKEYEKGKIKASLRTTHPDVDVSTYAQRFGGGGHKKASGYAIDGELRETPTGWEVVAPKATP